MSEKEKEKLEKRGRSIAALGLVNREGDYFKVGTPNQRGKEKIFNVWREAAGPDAGKVMCNCEDFKAEFTKDTNTAFRCEHILAVKFAILDKNVKEASTPAEGEKQAETPGKVQTAVHKDPPDGVKLSSCFEHPSGSVALFFCYVQAHENTSSFEFIWNDEFFAGYEDVKDLKKFITGMFKSYMKFEDRVWNEHKARLSK